MNVEKYLSNFFKGTKNNTLDAMKYFMTEFSHPEKNMKIIHIAGTNGKGSCTEMMSNILINAGYKVGKFISPHLIKYNERISINNNNIADEEMEKLIKRINPKIAKYNSTNENKVTLFELITTMALLYFNENNCDFVVLETGLGGISDCTNIVKPLISIITSIGYDHMHILGNTLEEIAIQKAGIIKQNSETIFIQQNEASVNKIIQETCIAKNNNLHLIKEKDITNYSYDSEFQKFDYKEHKNVLVNLKGKKQIYNASICIEATDYLRKINYNVSEKLMLQGLKTVVHRGRFEILNKNPTIIFDGAHNRPAIDNFLNSVDMYYKNDKKVYIVSILKTKDYASMLEAMLKDETSTFIFTCGNSKERYVDKQVLLEIAKKYTSNMNLYTLELQDAIKLVKEKYQDCITFVIGSFYIYGTVLDSLSNNEGNKY